MRHLLARTKTTEAPHGDCGASSVEGRQTIKNAMLTIMLWSHGNEKHNHELVLLCSHGCIVANVLVGHNHTLG